jgi:signal transduction histidine kinase
MSATSLHDILTTRRVEILSSVSPVSTTAPRLNALQDTALGCVLSLLMDNERPEIEGGIAAAAANAALAHSLADQLIALDGLEAAISALLQDTPSTQPSAGELFRISSFFCNARQTVIGIYSEKKLAIVKHFYSRYLEEGKRGTREGTGVRRRDAAFRKLHESVVEENQRLEESLATMRETQARLIQSEKLTAMTEFISGIAHEFNNPLTGIIGYTEFLLETSADETDRTKLQKIHREALRCKQIVQDLCDFARCDKPEKKIIGIESVIRNAVDRNESDYHSEGITLSARLSGAKTRIWGDPHQLQRVLLNLIDNAHQALASEGKGGTIEVRTEEDTERNCIWVHISDDGPGISPENLSKIFDPFFTTKEPGRGTGLGLSVAYGIVQEHEGEISIESVLHRGTTFRIKLPFVEHLKETVKDTAESATQSTADVPFGSNSPQRLEQAET